jgi:hypothetical protein
MGLVRMGAPTEIIEKLAATFQVKNFVKTGTYYGHTSIWASKNFQNVFTIEFSQAMYQQVIDKLNKISNLHCFLGDSRTELQKIIQTLQGSSIFWLDAHWSGGNTYGNNDECPLLTEIKIINNSPHEHFIFIDDARYFTSPPQPPHQIEQWPDITKVIHQLQSGNGEKYIVIIEDVIIAVPLAAKKMLAEYCQDTNAKAWEKYGKEFNKLNFKKVVNQLYLIYLNLKKIIYFLVNKERKTI